MWRVVWVEYGVESVGKCGGAGVWCGVESCVRCGGLIGVDWC